MADIKARSGGQWLPAVGPPGVITKSTSGTAFTRGSAASWVDDDAGGWSKLLDLYPATPTLTAINNSGRIDLSWTVTSAANIQKFEIYVSTDAVNYAKLGTDPVPSATSYIYGRASAPQTYYFFLRSVAYNGLYRDSGVQTVSIGGVTGWKSFSHSRGSSGWHTRSFTFTAGASSSSSTITNMTAYLYWRSSTSDAWSYVTSYSENNVLEMTKTYSFSAYDYGRRMFRVDVVLTDNQTKQNDGSTGTGYQFSNSWSTSDLTAADIDGAVPTMSGSAATISDPLSPPATTSNRSLSFVVGFDANADRSEYDSSIIVLYNTAWTEVSRQTVDIAYLKEQPWTRRELTYTFSSLPAGTTYYCILYVYDDQGTDRTVRNDQTTYALQPGSYTYRSGYTRGTYGGTYDAGDSFFRGNGTEYIGDAPYSGNNKAALRDNNDGTWYYTNSMGTSASSTTYQRIRAYNYRDYSTNSSDEWGRGNNPGYKLNWIQFVTPQTHSIYAQIYDYKSGTWLGYAGTDPSVGDWYIVYGDTVNGSWQINLTAGGNFEGLTCTRDGSTNNWYVDFDVRAVMSRTKVYGGVSGYRIGLSSIRVNTTWYSIYDNWYTGSYNY